MVNDLVGALIKLHPYFHLYRKTPPDIPGLRVSLAIIIYSPAVPRIPFKEVNIPQEHDLGNRFSIHVGR